MLKRTQSFISKIGAVMLSMQLVLVGLPQHNVFAATTNTTLPLRQMEYLDRGLVAVKVANGVFLSWRLLGTEPTSISFNVYRDGAKLNSAPITTSTNYSDASGTDSSTYYVTAIIDGVEQAPSEKVNVWGSNYKSLPLQKPADGVTPSGTTYTYNANDASVGDVDGDGQYEIILKWDPSNSQDNSLAGYTGDVYIDAYKLDGTRLWRIDLGKNIRAGAHYTQFMVYDLDGDGKAEIACKTADGTVDGKGTVIGDANADWRAATNAAGYTREGYVLEGPEYLTIFEGATGKALTTTNYDPPRGATTPAEMQTAWGDNYGNRVDRFLACIAYLDGVHPSLVMCRGYYTRLTMVAYNWRAGQLTKLWKFDSNDAGNSAYAGQGNHNLSVADVDGDGKDEIIYGSCAVDDNGTGLYTTGRGHGDAMHLGDLDPSRPGLEVWSVKETTYKTGGGVLSDAKTGEVIFQIPTTKDTGRGLSGDIDPRYLGEEVWGSTGLYLHDAKGNVINTTVTPSSINATTGVVTTSAAITNTPPMNFATWWDGDLSRELLDNNTIYKWNYNTSTASAILVASECASNNGTKATPCLQADLFGDWREEVVLRTTDSSALHIYTTTSLTNYRFYTLMQDPVYRLDIAWQNVAYNQPPHVSYYLGTGMTEVPTPQIFTIIPSEKSFTVNSTFNMDSLKANALLEVRSTITNNNVTSGSAIAIVALYDSNDKMVNLSYVSRDIAIGKTQNLNAGFKLPSDVTNYKVKVFVWDGTSLTNTTMQPLSNVVTMP